MRQCGKLKVIRVRVASSKLPLKKGKAEPGSGTRANMAATAVPRGLAAYAVFAAARRRCAATRHFDEQYFASLLRVSKPIISALWHSGHVRSLSIRPHLRLCPVVTHLCRLARHAAQQNFASARIRPNHFVQFAQYRYRLCFAKRNM
jgi:hypothetical protein